jgi:hypothetical protein
MILLHSKLNCVKRYCLTEKVQFSMLLLLFGSVASLDNGLARVPYMGWTSWEQFHCEERLANEDSYMEVITRLYKDGWVAAGYEYMSIDDCWLAVARNRDGYIVPDGVRFKGGIATLSAYAHKHGIKLGVSMGYGSKTCAGGMGLQGRIEWDMTSVTSWGVDYVRVDSCNSAGVDRSDGYYLVMQYLNFTHRPVLYVHDWPASDKNLNRSLLMRSANGWRLWPSITGDWKSVFAVIDELGAHPEWASFAGPGGWNDPGPILCGVKNDWSLGLTAQECRTQFSVWSIAAAPLMMSNKIDNILPWEKEILTNKEVIGLVHQDALGQPGVRVSALHGLQIWVRSLSNGRWAVALFNANESPQDIEVKFATISPTLAGKSLEVRDLWAHQDLGVHVESVTIKQVEPHDTALLLLTAGNNDL